jgi:hypothetical protein
VGFSPRGASAPLQAGRRTFPAIFCRRMMLLALVLPVLLFSGLLFSAPKREEAPQSVSDLFAAIATDLSQSDSSAFMSHFDSNMPGYDRLYQFISALCNQDDVGSAIDILKETGDDRQRAVELDWTLEIDVGKQAYARVEHRQEKVKCKLERRGKHWVVTALDPIAFFTPPSQ